MEILTNAVPQWVSLLFLVSFITPVFMIVNVIKQGVKNAQLQHDTPKYLPQFTLVFFISYYCYVTAMSFTGIFEVNTLPPRILILTAIPLALFYFLVVFRSKLFWHLLEHIKLSALVRIHTFRFVGVFFIIGWYYGILPKSFALVSGIGDIIVALAAIVVARAVDQKINHYKKMTLVWNSIGFWDIATVVFSAIYITHQAIESNTQGILEMTKFPLCFIPAFAPATIMFLHIVIFKKLKLKD